MTIYKITDLISKIEFNSLKEKEQILMMLNQIQYNNAFKNDTMTQKLKTVVSS